MIDFQIFAEVIGDWLEIAGILIIFAGFISSSVVVFARLFSSKNLHNLYRSYRHDLSRSILVGLEFLVAGDIIRSVTGDLTLSSIIVLAILILIRLLLGISLEMEIDGHWPWQRFSKNRR